MHPDLTSNQQRGHRETGLRFKVSSERPEKRGIDHAIPGTTAAPASRWEGLVCRLAGHSNEQLTLEKM